MNNYAPIPLPNYMDSAINTDGLNVSGLVGTDMQQSMGGQSGFDFGGMLKGWLGGTDAKTGQKSGNMFASGLAGVKGLADSWMAMQQLDLAKEQFGFQKDAWNKNYENQRTLTNGQLRDRQNARLSADPSAYQSVGDYMDKNGV